MNDDEVDDHAEVSEQVFAKYRAAVAFYVSIVDVCGGDARLVERCIFGSMCPVEFCDIVVGIAQEVLPYPSGIQRIKILQFALFGSNETDPDIAGLVLDRRRCREWDVGLSGVLYKGGKRSLSRAAQADLIEWDGRVQ